MVVGLAAQHAEHVLRRYARDLGLRLDGVRADVRRYHYPVRYVLGEERVSRRERLRAVDVCRESAEPSVAHRLRDSSLVDDAAARAVHEVRAVLEDAQHAFVYHVRRLFGERRVYRHHVGERYGPFEVAHQLDMERIGLRVRDVRVVGDDLHTEGARALRDFAAYPAEADDEQLFAAELAAREFVPVPFSGVERGAGLRDHADDGEHVRHRQLRRRERVSARRVDDYYPAAARGWQVDVVYADSRAAYDLEPVSGLDFFLVHRRAAARQYRVDAGELFDYLLVREAEGDFKLHLGRVSEYVEAGLSDLLRYKDFPFIIHLVSAVQSFVDFACVRRGVIPQSLSALRRKRRVFPQAQPRPSRCSARSVLSSL